MKQRIGDVFSIGNQAVRHELLLRTLMDGMLLLLRTEYIPIKT